MRATDATSLADVRSRTLLVYPPVGVANGQSYLPFPPSGLAYLRGYLEERGHPRIHVSMPTRRYPDTQIAVPAFGLPSERVWTQFPGAIGADDEDVSLRAVVEAGLTSEIDVSTDYLAEVLQLACEPDTRIVGLSCGLPSQIYTSLALGKAIKRANPNVFVVIGGPLITENIEYLKDIVELTSAIDGIIVGWGEVPLEQLIKCLEFGGELDKVANFYYATEEGLQCSHASWTPGRECMLTVPVYEGDNRAGSIWPYLSVRPAIGCYWSKCSFCTYPAKYDKDVVDRVVLLKPEELVDYMRVLVERYQTNAIFVAVDALPPNYLRPVAERILETGLDVRWTAWVCVDKRFTRRDELELLRRSGFTCTLLGVESVNERILRRMNKMQTADNIPEVIKAFLDSDIALDVTSIIGFPGETRDEAMKTIEFMLSLAGPTVPIVYRYCLMGGSPVANNLEQFGIRSVDWSDKYFIMDGFAYQYEVNEGLTFEETKELALAAGAEIQSRINSTTWARRVGLIS